MWGGFWYPLRLLEDVGIGGAWVSVIFFAVAVVSPLPWLLRRSAWEGFGSQLVNGALMGLAFTLYTVSLVLTDVIHAILLFYLTPVWSTLAGIFLFRRAADVQSRPRDDAGLRRDDLHPRLRGWASHSAQRG